MMQREAKINVRVVLSDEKWEERRRLGKVWKHQAKCSHWRWAASSGLDHVPLKGIWQIGHGRWDIENKAFNLLTRDYHLNHCYHHHPVAIMACLLLTLLAVNVTTLFYRNWVAPRAQADYTRSDLIDDFREGLAWTTDEAPIADTS